jgi:cellulose synthase/poly-beta-1,6-N-acetylglucosamine synthase-like glycosyltransferase
VQHILPYLLNAFNFLLVAYFVAGNGAYSFLMLVSLASIWGRNRASGSLLQLRESPLTPPATVILPAWNEQEVVVDAVRSVFAIDYPGVQVCVVDDGSTDETLARLIQAFNLAPAVLIARPRLDTHPVRAYYTNPEIPNLLVISKANGGKPDALNAAINMCRTPYFCTLDADCILEPDALLRLMLPVLQSPVPVMASGGIVRVLNGCTVTGGRVVKVDLPRRSLERFQVVEYLRSFLFGRTGWNLLGGTAILSGAFALFQTAAVLHAGGFSGDTVSEDMDLVLRLRSWAAAEGRKLRILFTAEPVCWSQSPADLAMLRRQRRRWQLGLCQTLQKNSRMLFRPAFGALGLLSLPFQTLVEALGAVVELLGYVVIPLAAVVEPALLRFLLPFVVLSLAYAAFISIGAVTLEEITYRRYPSPRNLAILLLYALLENFGYRQVVLWFRFEGVCQFLLGHREWEKVAHRGVEPRRAARAEGSG